MKIHLFLKRMLLLWVFAFSASMWGQTTSILQLANGATFGTSSPGTKNTSDNAVTWTATGNNFGSWNSANYFGQQFGTSSIKFSGTFSAPEILGKKITTIAIRANAGNASVYTLSVKVGGTTYSPASVSVAKNSSATSNAAVPLYTFTGNSTGAIVVTVASTSNVAFYLNSIAITYEDAITLPATIALSDNGTQIATGNVTQGATNHILSSFKVSVTDANSILNEARFLTDGNYNASDISNFKLWYNSTNSFSGATSLGSKSSTSTGTGGDLLEFTGLTRAINAGSTGYFWLTTDITTGATAGKAINLTAIPNLDLIFANGNKSGSASAAGLQTIIADTTPKFLIESISNVGFGNTCLTSTSANTASFDLYGYNLTGNVTVGPLAGYTFSIDNSNFSNQLNLTPDGSGAVSESVYVRFTPTLVQSYNGNIAISGGGATATSVAVTGAGINTPPTVTVPTSTAVTATSATLGGNITVAGCSPITERGIYYSTTSGFADGAGIKVSETGTFSTGVFTISTGSVLTASTTYYYKAFASSESGVAYSAQGSFTTSCTATTVPYTQNFESAVTPAIPNCNSVQNAGAGNVWETANLNANGFDSKVLQYKYNSSKAADAWYYTQGINLTSGTVYRISYKYGNNSSDYTEKLKVTYGNAAVNTAMTNAIADYPNVTGGSATITSVDFTAPSTGIFYFGFNAYSAVNEYNLYVDDILVELAPTCLVPTMLTSTTITANSATLNWTASLSNPAGGYDYYYSTTNTAPDGATAPSGNVGSGVTTVNITGLSSNTTYYYWVRANCGASDKSLWVAGGSFTTTIIAAPVATAATDITQTGFTANWDVVAGATGYELEVSKSSTFGTFTSGTLTEGFDNGNTPPTGWTFTGLGSPYTSSGNFGLSSPSLKFDGSTDQVITSILSGNATELKFWLKSQGADVTSAFLVEGYNGSSWVTIENITDISGIFTYVYNSSSPIILPANISQFRFTYTKSSGNVSFDDVNITYGTSIPDLVDGYNPKIITDGSTITAAVTDLSPGTKYYYRVRAKDAGSTSVNSNVIDLTTAGAVTWNGSAWSNVDGPDATIDATINGNYNIVASFAAKDLTVNSPFTLTVPSTGFVKAVNVYNNGTIIVANNGNFVQTGTFTAGGSSTFKVNRTTKPVVRLDYNSWSSPMFTSTQNLLDFSPGTLPSRFLTYNNNKFEAVTSPATTKFTPGAGYLIRTSNTYTTTPTPFDGQFVGTVPNSGDVTYAPSIAGNYVFLGNPYPSAISMEDFYNENSTQMQTATFYIWNSESKMNTSNVYVNPYNTQTAAGSNPYGAEFYVPVGQGFLIDRGTRTTSSFLFKNSMRRTSEAGTFAKTAVVDRFWLQMTSPAGLKPQLLVGFTPNATSGFDAGYDGKLLESNGDVIYSTVDNKSLVITALGTLSSTDVINVTANFASAGNYTFDIAQKEGVFENGQQIYLKDNVTGIETELTSANYTFAATAGLQADRFTVSFSKGVLASSNATKAQSTIYAENQIVHVKGASKIASVEVYDMSGKLVKTTKNVNSENTSLAVANKGVAVVKLVLENGEVVTKKVILK